MKSIKINAIINGMKTLLLVIFPLITFPYAARVLGVEGVGKYNFAYSIISYFALLSALGIYNYAVREGASLKDNYKKLSIFASEILEFNIISMIIALFLLIVLCLLWGKLHSYIFIFFILSFNIILTTFGCEWIYAIREEYVYMALRGVLFQILSMLFLFLFVHSYDDLVAYCITTVLSTSGYNILNILGLKKFFKFKLQPINSLKRHFSPIMLLFANSIATTIYINSDITILGMLSGNHSVGLYSVSTKVYSIIKAVLASIIVVSIPKMSNLWSNKEYTSFNIMANKILNCCMLLTIPAITGVIVLVKEILLFISGINYIEATISMKILSIALFVSVLNWFFQSSILIPSKNEKKVLYSSSIAAIVNIVLNFILIPFYSENAAAFTTLVAETISCIISGFYSFKFIKLEINKNNVLSIIFGAITIYLFCKIIQIISANYLFTLSISIVGSLLIYIAILIVLKNTLLTDLLKQLKIKIRGR